MNSGRITDVVVHAVSTWVKASHEGRARRAAVGGRTEGVTKENTVAGKPGRIRSLAWVVWMDDGCLFLVGHKDQDVGTLIFHDAGQISFKICSISMWRC